MKPQTTISQEVDRFGLWIGLWILLVV